ncbi:MAG TPA: MerR family transcriptional regulator [Bacillota bacterium]
MPEEWLTLPQIARELGIAESTARRWAAAFAELLPARGRGSARRFHPQARQVLARARALFEQGLTTDEVAEALRREFPATLDVTPASEGRAEHERSEPAVLRALIAEHFGELVREAIREETRELVDALHKLMEQNEALRRELAAAREREAERDARLVAEMRRLLEERRRRRWWWPWGRT